MKKHTMSSCPVFAAVLISLMATACGGGSSTESPAPAPAPVAAGPAPATGDIDLNDPKMAIKMSSAMLASTHMSRDFHAPLPWTADVFTIPTGTRSFGCTTLDLVNADGIPGAGDTFSEKTTNCTISEPASSLSRTYTGTGSSTLEAISNGTTPALSAWTAREASQASRGHQWSIKATSNNYAFDGTSSAVYSIDSDVNHLADGTQADNVRIQVTTIGSENGAAFEYAADASFVCSYPASATTSDQEKCKVNSATLKGNYSGKRIDVTLSQQTLNSADLRDVFDIVQGAQKVTVTFARGATAPTVTLPNGTSLTIPAGNLMYLAGY